MREHQKTVLSVVFVVTVFILFSWAGKHLLEVLPFGELLSGRFGMLAYVLLVAGAVIVAPFSAVPFIPLATELWGVVPAAIFNIIGWTIGSGVAFLIARSFGKPVVARMVGAETISGAERFLPRRRMFWSVVFLRMALPVDILSYALGLLSPMRFSSYLLATLIGVSPFSFIFSYAAALPLAYQFIVGVAIVGFVVAANVLFLRRKSENARDTKSSQSYVSYIPAK